MQDTMTMDLVEVAGEISEEKLQRLLEMKELVVGSEAAESASSSGQHTLLASSYAASSCGGGNCGGGGGSCGSCRVTGIDS